MVNEKLTLRKESGGMLGLVFPDGSQEYLNAIVKGDIEAEEEYKRKCLEVKAKYPKELV